MRVADIAVRTSSRLKGRQTVVRKDLRLLQYPSVPDVTSAKVDRRRYIHIPPSIEE